MLSWIDEFQQNDLLAQPESGMGYQLVENGEVLILNARLAITLDEGAIPRDDFDWLNRIYFSEFRFDERRERTPAIINEERIRNQLNPYKRGLVVETHHSYPSIAKQGEGFSRYSAFFPDNRIRPDGEVHAGTYASTVLDRKMVPSGLVAVGRYALPLSMPAQFEYRIGPIPGAHIYCGTCTPLFNQSGGGVEVRFQSPLPAGTANFTPTTIPER